MSDTPDDLPLPGVRALDHAADVGLEVDASDLSELLRRAVGGLAWLLLEREPPFPTEERALRVAAGEPASLLRELLRELLWWHDSEGLVAGGLRNVRLAQGTEGVSLEAMVALSSPTEPPVREIKGVTLHGLLVEQREGGWHARVIFDV